MKRILCSDWLPVGQDGPNLPARDRPLCSRKSEILVMSRWLEIGLDIFCVSTVFIKRKTELGQYPVILTSHLVNNAYVPFKALYFFAKKQNEKCIIPAIFYR